MKVGVRAAMLAKKSLIGYACHAERLFLCRTKYIYSFCGVRHKKSNVVEELCVGVEAVCVFQYFQHLGKDCS